PGVVLELADEHDCRSAVGEAADLDLAGAAVARHEVADDGVGHAHVDAGEARNEQKRVYEALRGGRVREDRLSRVDDGELGGGGGLLRLGGRRGLLGGGGLLDGGGGGVGCLHLVVVAGQGEDADDHGDHGGGRAGADHPAL